MKRMSFNFLGRLRRKTAVSEIEVADAATTDAQVDSETPVADAAAPATSPHDAERPADHQGSSTAVSPVSYDAEDAIDQAPVDLAKELATAAEVVRPAEGGSDSAEPSNHAVDSVDGPESDKAEASASDERPRVKGWLAKLRKRRAADDEQEVPSASTATGKASRTRFAPLPIRVIIGYLPEVTENDALEYGLGIAEKHFEQLGMAFYDAYKYDGGFVFEVHEGGEGKAFIPQILKYFESQGPYRTGEHVSVVLRTATRKVEVQRNRAGLAAVILPENSDTEPTPWLQGSSSMTPALNKRTGLLVAGAALFVTGFIGFVVSAFVARFQPYEEAPQAKPDVLSMTSLPVGQWASIQAVPAGSYVKALRYRNGRWEAPELATEQQTAPAPDTGPQPPVPAAPQTH